MRAVRNFCFTRMLVHPSSLRLMTGVISAVPMPIGIDSNAPSQRSELTMVYPSSAAPAEEIVDAHLLGFVQKLERLRR